MKRLHGPDSHFTSEWIDEEMRWQAKEDIVSRIAAFGRYRMESYDSRETPVNPICSGYYALLSELITYTEEIQYACVVWTATDIYRAFLPHMPIESGSEIEEVGRYARYRNLEDISDEEAAERGYCLGLFEIRHLTILRPATLIK